MSAGPSRGTCTLPADRDRGAGTGQTGDVSSVELAGVTVSRGGQRLLGGVDLHVGDGERFALLGPSGAGKTTLLRVVAGLEPVDEGHVLIGDRDVTGARPAERNVSMVTQDGMLHPHLDVEHNLAFSLRLRRLPRAEIDARVRAEARAFSLLGLLQRRPQTLSAGERHEVSLARSLVRRSSVLLADEPFARIDPHRLATMIRELHRVQEGYGVTLLLATNDQRVALGIAQRTAVIADGRVVQVGSPLELFRRPANIFIAGFLGDEPSNLLAADLARVDGRTVLRAPGLSIPTWQLALTKLAPKAVQLGIRPADVEVAGTQPGDVEVAADRLTTVAAIEGLVEHREFRGSMAVITTSTPAGAIRVRCAPPGPHIGERITLRLPPMSIHVFDSSGNAIVHGV